MTRSFMDLGHIITLRFSGDICDILSQIYIVSFESQVENMFFGEKRERAAYTRSFVNEETIVFV